ncbi:hypothetical protein FB451DRAFT_1237701 [Mycena latifolia]|nr:hypothetical protein FB451DRAFT_1237701 [Mycena latifolia]
MPLLPFLPLGLSPSSSLGGFGWPSLALLLPLLALLALLGYLYLPHDALRSRLPTLPFPSLPFPFRVFPCLPYALRPCSHPNPTAPIPGLRTIVCPS